MNTLLLDVHAHFTPPRSVETDRALWEAGRREHFLLPEPFTWRLDETLAVMDETGTAMQLLSKIPTEHGTLRDSNDYGAEIVGEHPSRFGLLAALPTDDPDRARQEIRRHGTADGWAVTTVYNRHSLADPALDPVWQELDDRRAVVFVHPNAYAPASAGLPAPLAEVTFDTGRTVVAMLYAGVFTRFPNITFVIAHAGGTLPVLAGRLALLGAEAWVPNPRDLSRDDIAATLRRLWVDTAASASTQQLAAAAATVGDGHIVYGSDWGVPCTTAHSLVRNIEGLQTTTALSPVARTRVRNRARELFPDAVRRTRPR
ncbi:amidohydrolase family protein [Lentzea sp. NPDC092896]|uniref:amidohydrolase family protein n=1 Tax=Lentzea sp. NPDC092896 TaxID=3364127 RepID=UPI0038259E65